MVKTKSATRYAKDMQCSLILFQSPKSELVDISCIMNKSAIVEHNEPVLHVLNNVSKIISQSWKCLETLQSNCSGFSPCQSPQE